MKESKISHTLNRETSFYALDSSFQAIPQKSKKRLLEEERKE